VTAPVARSLENMLIRIAYIGGNVGQPPLQDDADWCTCSPSAPSQSKGRPEHALLANSFGLPHLGGPDVFSQCTQMLKHRRQGHGEQGKGREVIVATQSTTLPLASIPQS
jgi:hypothetical protein